MKLDWFELIKVVVPIVIGLIRPELAHKASEIIDAVTAVELHPNGSKNVDKLNKAVNLMDPSTKDLEISEIMSKSVDIVKMLQK